MKPLTIKELKSLEVGDWVWIKDTGDKDGCILTGYYQIKGYNETHIHLQQGLGVAITPYALYGKWLAYKNKEQAETPKTETKPMTLNEAIDHLRTLIPKLDCESCADEHKQLLVWLTELRDIKRAETTGEIMEFPCKVRDKAWYVVDRGKLSKIEETYVKHIVVYAWGFEVEFEDTGRYLTFNSDGTIKNSFNIYLDKSEAERRLAELTKE